MHVRLLTKCWVTHVVENKTPGVNPRRIIFAAGTFLSHGKRAQYGIGEGAQTDRKKL